MFRVRSKEIQRYTPAGRLYHQAVSIDGKVYMWGGAGSVNPRAVEVFDLCNETWVQHITKGTPHPGLYSVACTASEGHLYAYGGMSDRRHRAILSKLDVSTFTWSRISPHDPNGGPMRKWECGLVCFHGCILTLFGGYGIPNDPIQPGSEFIQDERYKHNEVGWTNELHAFDLRKGQCAWFSPSVRGTRPPPCRNFTFVCINGQQALLYGGYLPEGKIRVSDLYLFDFSDSETMDIVKLEPKKGNKWPIGRACHAACCLGYGSDNPILFVIGGGTTDEKMLPNAWTFDVVSRVWTELILPRPGSFPRTFHVATSTTLSSGYDEVTIFGGCDGPAFGVSIHDIPKLANTTVITFEKVTGMVTVMNDDGLGTFERIQEKLVKISALTRTAKVVIEENDSSLVSLALIESERAQEQVKWLEKQLTMESDKKKVAEAKVKEVQEAKKQQEEDLSQANERAQVAEKRSHDLEQRSHDAEQRLRDAELRATAAERRLHSAEQRAMEASKRAQYTTVQTQDDQCWVLQSNEIEITEKEIGRGGWAAVKVANFRGTRVAAKCFYQEILVVSQYNRQLFNREMYMAAHLRHPNLVQFIGASLEGEPIILTELMTTSLRAVLETGPLPLSVMISISLDVLRALNYLHLMKPHPIIHRDISSANVLLDSLPDNQWKAKVSDYGSVNVLQQLQTVGPGSPVYAAPEASTPALQSPKMDIFSFGILLVEMFTDQFPEVDNRQHLISLIDHNGFSRLVKRCLSEDRDQRPSASELITAVTDLH